MAAIDDLGGWAASYDPRMNDLDFARSQMAMSLAFHIVFAAMGIGMPVLMCVAEALHLRTGRAVYLDLCKRWARGTAILFAVGAVSGTVLSFELGLLWPGFMKDAGGIIGMPFSLEGFAFFTEAIFLGVYLFGWDRIPPFMHWLSGVVLALSGILSGVFVVRANAWMNAPAGFKRVGGKFTEIDPIAAMLNPGSLHEVLHMTLAAFIALGFAVAGVHAFFLLRDRGSEFHRAALKIALILARGEEVRQRWGILFGAACSFTPLTPGMVLGEVATGQIRCVDTQVTTGFFAGWLTPFALACGLFGIVLCAFLSAIYLTLCFHQSPAPETTLRLLTFALGAGAVLLFLYQLFSRPQTRGDAQS